MRALDIQEDLKTMKQNSQTPRFRRVLAFAGVLILAGLYLASLILAILGDERSSNLLMASIFASIVLPVLLYAYQLAWKITHRDREEDGNS